MSADPVFDAEALRNHNDRIADLIPPREPQRASNEKPQAYLRAGGSPGSWARLLHRHLEAWFAAFHPGSMQHDALALSTALGKAFVHLDPERVSLDRIGRMNRDHDGAEVRLSSTAEYGPFNAWLERALFG